MNGIEKIIEHIRSESDAKCKEIAMDAAETCEQIRAEYSQIEQEEYWNTIDKGTKETEERYEQLTNLASVEAQKKLRSSQREMLDEAFALAAKKVSELPANKYKELLKRHNLDSSTSPGALVGRYKDALSQTILTILFD